jgi:hypothetical protein
LSLGRVASSPAEPQVEPGSPVTRPEPSHVIALQQSAGNAAVNSLAARAPAAPVALPRPPAPRGATPAAATLAFMSAPAFASASGVSATLWSRGRSGSRRACDDRRHRAGL